MRNLNEVRLSIIVYLSEKILDILEEMDGRKGFVKDMRTSVFCLKDLANKESRNEQLKDEKEN